MTFHRSQLGVAFAAIALLLLVTTEASSQMVSEEVPIPTSPAPVLCTPRPSETRTVACAAPKLYGSIIERRDYRCISGTNTPGEWTRVSGECFSNDSPCSQAQYGWGVDLTYPQCTVKNASQVPAWYLAYLPASKWPAKMNWAIYQPQISWPYDQRDLIMEFSDEASYVAFYNNRTPYNGTNQKFKGKFYNDLCRNGNFNGKPWFWLQFWNTPIHNFMTKCTGMDAAGPNLMYMQSCFCKQ